MSTNVSIPESFKAESFKADQKATAIETIMSDLAQESTIILHDNFKNRLLRGWDGATLDIPWFIGAEHRGNVKKTVVICRTDEETRLCEWRTENTSRAEKVSINIASFSQPSDWKTLEQLRNPLKESNQSFDEDEVWVVDWLNDVFASFTLQGES